MAYYNPYFESREDGVESVKNYTFEEFLDGKPPMYFLAFIKHNYEWTKNEGLDSFSFRLSPCCVFWHDRLYDMYCHSQIKDFLFTMMERAGLLDEPVMLMVEYARTMASYKVQTEKTLINGEDGMTIVQIPESERVKEENWKGRFTDKDIAMFSEKYELRDGLFQVKEKHGVIDKTGREADRWMRFLVFDPKSE